MVITDNSGLLGLVQTFFGLVGGALTLDRAAFVLVEQSPRGILVALTVLVLGGASATLGQCTVLFLNRVSPRRFCVALLLGGLQFAALILVWIALVWGADWATIGAPRPLASVVRVIGLAQAPLLFSFFVLIPVIGLPLGRILRIWALLASVVGMAVVFTLPAWHAALIAALGYAVGQAVIWLTGDLATRLQAWFERLQTGQTHLIHPEDLVDLLPKGTPADRGDP